MTPIEKLDSLIKLLQGMRVAFQNNSVDVEIASTVAIMNLSTNSYLSEYSHIIDLAQEHPESVAKVIKGMPTQVIVGMLSFPVHCEPAIFSDMLVKELDKRGIKAKIEKEPIVVTKHHVKETIIVGGNKPAGSC